jgi:hypothetical protein
VLTNQARLAVSKSDQAPDEESKGGQAKAGQGKIKEGYVQDAISFVNPDLLVVWYQITRHSSFMFECKVDLHRFESS